MLNLIRHKLLFYVFCSVLKLAINVYDIGLIRLRALASDNDNHNYFRPLRFSLFFYALIYK